LQEAVIGGGHDSLIVVLRVETTTAPNRDAADNRIRILHLISDSQATEYFRLIARYTDHERFYMRVASLHSAGELQTGLAEIGVPTFAIAADSRNQYPLAVLRLASWLRRERVDVLHAHLFEASIVGLLAARLAAVQVRVFTGHHSHEVPLHQRWTLFELDRFVARRLANVVVAPSNEMGDTFVALYGCAPSNVVVIEHGLDLARFDPRRVRGDGVRRELGLAGKLVFGAISKHFWVKNLDALLRAFAALAGQRDDVHLVVLGIGDSSSLAARVAELGLGSRVSIVAPRRDVPAVLAALDVFVHPALAESFGFVIVEAMAMERPVVVTPVGIARDIVQDGVSGILAHGTDPEALTEAMTRALGCRDRWPELGRAARERALAFTPERWVRSHEQLYEQRLQRR
jgi:glycosyltransferase involved in cell wall biosynthesis